jgi:hypothetical protein
MTIADHAAGRLQGAADAAQSVKHDARAWSADQHPRDREADAQERWHTGQPARNHFERDVYRALEAGISGIDRPKEAAAARQLPPYPEIEAGE